MSVLTDTTPAVIEYRGFTIETIRATKGYRYQPITPNGERLDWFCKSIAGAEAVIDSRIRRAEQMARQVTTEALARALAPEVTAARKLGRRAIDEHPLV